MHFFVQHIRWQLVEEYWAIWQAFTSIQHEVNVYKGCDWLQWNMLLVFLRPWKESSRSLLHIYCICHWQETYQGLCFCSICNFFGFSSLSKLMLMNTLLNRLNSLKQEYLRKHYICFYMKIVLGQTRSWFKPHHHGVELLQACPRTQVMKRRKDQDLLGFVPTSKITPREDSSSWKGDKAIVQELLYGMKAGLMY